MIAFWYCLLEDYVIPANHYFGWWEINLAMPISLQKIWHSPQKRQSKICSIVPTGEKEMIKKFSKYLSDYFIKIGIVERKNKSWCQYVIEKKTIRLIFGMTALIFSLYIKRPLETVLFLHLHLGNALL